MMQGLLRMRDEKEMRKGREWKTTRFQSLETSANRANLVPPYVLCVPTATQPHTSTSTTCMLPTANTLHKNTINASPPLTVVECPHCDRLGELPSSSTGVPCHSDVVLDEGHQARQEL